MQDEHKTGPAVPSFQESAKKFKPGPVAPPEEEETRRLMSGATPGAATADPSVKPGAAVSSVDHVMSDGTPGRVQQTMPGE